MLFVRFGAWTASLDAAGAVRACDRRAKSLAWLRTGGEGEPDQLREAACAHFIHYACTVNLDRARADPEIKRN